MLSFVGDAVVALLLIATIGYSMVLNRRLGTVRSDREKFETLVRNLTTASTRAEAAVTGLRVATDELGRRLEKKVDEARALADDLTYMIERGGNMADKLANQIRVGREDLKPDFRTEPKPAPRPQARPEHVVEPVLRPAARYVEPQYQPEPVYQAEPHYQPQPVQVRAAAPSQPRRVEFPVARANQVPVNSQAAMAQAAVVQAVVAEARREAPSRDIAPREAQRSEVARPAPRPAFVRSEPRAEAVRVEPRVNIPAGAVMEAEAPLAERANAPSRAERDLLRALAARRR